VSALGRNDRADISGYVAQAAVRMHERLAEVSSFIRRSLEDDIPELRGNARIIELHGAASKETSTLSCARCDTTSRCSTSKRRLQRSSSRGGWHNTTLP
jgi:hypothetical protein